ncbi:MAG: LAGLIDADG family homing endonuclease [Candidatus Heimdallarchaeaceae archaeon]
MQITKEEVVNLIETTKDQEELKQVLRYIFSFKENITVFSQVMFPETVTNKIPDFHHEIYEFLFSTGNGALAAPRGHAKLLSLDSDILTPSGWIKLSELKVGDYVYGMNGKKKKVIQLHPIKKVPLFRFKTRDGRSVLCNDGHLWKVQCPSNTGDKLVTKYTQDIMKNYKSKRIDKRSNKEFTEYRYFLPSCKPIDFNEKVLPIDPYVLGCWIADGTSSSGQITTGDPEIFEYFDYKITKHKAEYGYGVLGLHKELRQSYLIGNKHIPTEYMTASIEQRESMLQGLVDSDGYVQKGGKRFGLATSKKNLKDDYVALIRSLGGTVTVGERLTRFDKDSEYKHSYVLTCRVPSEIIPVRLKRKRGIWRGSIKTKSSITDITFEKEAIGRCISVEGDGTFITNDYMVTHNSSVTGIIYLIFCIVNNLEKYIVYVSQNHSKTVQFIDPIRNEFKNNEMLRFVYGDLTPSKSRDEFGKDREDCFDVGGCRVEAVSFEKNLRGFKYNNMRPTLIVADDVEDDQRVLNPDLRVKDSNKLNKVIIPSLDIKGRYKMIGTILHPNSLLTVKIKQCKGKIFQACDENMNNILWKDRFTKDILTKIKKEIGSVAFQQEYLNNPIDNTSSLIKREWVTQCFREDLSAEDIKEMQFEMKTLGVDFAFSDRVTADESAFFGLGSKDDFFYMLGSQKEKGWSVDEQMKYIRDTLHPLNTYDLIGLEENSIKAISKDINQWNLPITLFWTSASDPAARLKPDYDWTNKRHTVGKINLIMRLGTAFENKQFIIPYKTEQDKLRADRILAECTSFALSDGKLVEAGIHPDIPIAMGYALELMNNNKVVMNFG